VAILDGGNVLLNGTMDEVRSPGSSEVELVLSSDDEAAKAQSKLSADPRVRGMRRRGATLQLEVNAPLAVREIVAWGFDVREFRTGRRSLEDVYFEVLGKGAVA
jgi:ABC-type multidrug transport system ATPase subunit